MPRVMTRFGCTSNDGVHVKFLAEGENRQSRLGQHANKRSERIQQTKRCCTKKNVSRLLRGVRVMSVVSFVSCGRLYVSQCLGFVVEQRTHERLDKCLSNNRSGIGRPWDIMRSAAENPKWQKRASGELGRHVG
jgi:hypothetical protein